MWTAGYLVLPRVTANHGHRAHGLDTEGCTEWGGDEGGIPSHERSNGEGSGHGIVANFTETGGGGDQKKVSVPKIDLQFRFDFFLFLGVCVGQAEELRTPSSPPPSPAVRLSRGLGGVGHARGRR